MLFHFYTVFSILYQFILRFLNQSTKLNTIDYVRYQYNYKYQNIYSAPFDEDLNDEKNCFFDEHARNSSVQQTLFYIGRATRRSVIITVAYKLKWH